MTRISTDSNDKPNQLRMVLIFVISISLVGCGAYADNLPERHAPSPVVEIGTNHNPAECGTVSGQVTWVGEIPVVPSMVVLSIFQAGFA